MQEWFLSLDGAMQLFWGVAIVASVIFLVQTILTFVGVDSADGLDADMDFGDGDTMDAGGMASLFSIRSMINFFVGFGWAGVSLRSLIAADWLLILVSLLIGFFFAYWYIFFRKKLMKLESNGAYKLSDSIGKEADVYLRIPDNGRGKIQISLGGSIHEVDATSEEGAIPTGKRVRVVSIEGNVAKVKEI